MRIRASIFTVLLLAGLAGALPISEDPISLYSFLPDGSVGNGENDIFCQYYDFALGTYVDMVSGNNGLWKADLLYGVPTIVNVATDIEVTQSTVSRNQINLWSVINIGPTCLEGTGSVRVQGSVFTTSGGPLHFSIYKGLDSITRPDCQVWTINGAGAFDFEVPFVNGERLLLACASDESGTLPVGLWQDVQFTLVPEPATMAVLALGALLIRKR